MKKLIKVILIVLSGLGLITAALFVLMAVAMSGTEYDLDDDPYY